MRIRLALTLLVPVVLLGTAGCGSNEASTSTSGSGTSTTPSNATSAGLGGTAWVLESYQGAALPSVPAVQGANTTLAFANEGTVTGSTGCNQFSGTYTASGQQLTIELGPMTQMACTGPLLTAQETAIVQSMPQVASFNREGDTLTLLGADGTTLLTYIAGLSGLEETTWNVTGVNNGADAVETTALTENLTATFGPAGAFSGFGGCNNLTGAYTTSGTETLGIAELAGTTKSCTPEIDALEAQYATALEQVATYAISGNQLTLRNREGATQVTLRQGT